ncbi:RmlC-like cupin domain-containing protein [Ephemerocybe angulata]|uniref:RmlC-like cupin domain-containing protein n=1 Tax=Ephemerocybe angulata TaxID=980116 RepID=A0A8H6LVA9_9AGAR|nr:RmlC-like cupin domain-containing protein [Tulosesus angulatus]
MTATSSRLIASLELEKHPEGGYFKVTDVQDKKVPSPFAGDAPRLLATTIYYLLSHDRPKGFIHMNKSLIYHALHQGRAQYTLITPSSVPGQPPKIEKHIIGPNEAAGENRFLLVGTGVWKMSQLLDEDTESATTEEAKDKVNCLITEVVVPGFDWEDHNYLTKEGLEELFAGDAKAIEEFGKYLKEE